MPFHLVDRAPRGTIPITPLAAAGLGRWLAGPGKSAAAWVRATGFNAEPGAVSLVPGKGANAGKLVGVLVGMPAEDLWTFAGLPATLPAGVYRIEAELAPEHATSTALGWALGTYSYAAYKKVRKRDAALVWPKGADKGRVRRTTEAIFLARNLINTPASDLGPAELAAAARRVANHFRAAISVIEGDDLVKHNYPLIHAVGRASPRAPRLIDLTWGDAKAPKVTLVGKGVCFDSGGLDLKTASGMLMMKKDMGGAATLLALAYMIMDARLPVRLRLLIPAVENSVAGNAMRPLDIVRSRKGLTVEIGNTDAEGRLILADALAEADAEKPDLIVDCATLTGAARVALGPELPALFSNDDGLAAEILEAGTRVGDPLWRLPLWRPYRAMLESKTADINNAPESGFAGSVTAALFLEEFVGRTTPWAHIDSYAWNNKSRPGRPEGGEALGLRALFATIEARFKRGAAR